MTNLNKKKQKRLRELVTVEEKKLLKHHIKNAQVFMETGLKMIEEIQFNLITYKIHLILKSNIVLYLQMFNIKIIQNLI